MNNKTIYPYFTSAKVNSGQLVKINKNKKFKTYKDCYDDLFIWFNKHPKSYDEGQFVIIEYVNLYYSVIKTIITNKVEKNI
jgi:capsid portal protein